MLPLQFLNQLFARARDSQENEATILVHPEESETVDKYSIPEPQQQISEGDDRDEEEIPVDEPVASLVSASNLQDQPLPVEEPIREQPKHTYASILRVAKWQPGPAVPPQSTVAKGTPAQSEWHQA
ncbi:hypothetical protein Taro_036849 [Colocasia esculenta]|uniref:Uncharacterized protein n=1 Tax=Colocasia esculenta TaxID=4460 RepID=A0A843W7Z7_COLES|nr:hypothetical protein [Colocasia esculenta]